MYSMIHMAILLLNHNREGLIMRSSAYRHSHNIMKINTKMISNLIIYETFKRD